MGATVSCARENGDVISSPDANTSGALLLLEGGRLAAKHDFSGLPVLDEKRRLHFPGTREWLFLEVEQWLVDERGPSLFWLMGGGGTGKTVVSAVLLGRLRPAAWHFCRHDDAAKSEPVAVIKSLASMLCDSVPGFAGAVDAAAAAAALGSAKPERVFAALLGEPLKRCANLTTPPEKETPVLSSKPLVVVIDALDELPRGGRAELLRVIRDFAEAMPPLLRLFVTSREEPDIKAALGAFKPTELRVDAERNRDDVKAYLTHVAKRFVRNDIETADLERDAERTLGLDSIRGALEPLREPILKQREIYDAAVASFRAAAEGDGSFDALLAVVELQPSPRQPLNDLDALRDDAREAQALLRTLIEQEWAFPDAVIPEGVKSRERALEKIANDYDNEPNQLKDLAHATLVFDDCRGLVEALSRLRVVSPEVKIVALKNKASTVISCF